MDELALSATLGLVSLSVSQGYLCWSNSRKKAKLAKMRVSALVMSKATGKSTLCEHLQGHKDLKVIDVSDSVERDQTKNAEVEYLIHAKEYVERVKKELPDYKLVLLCNSVQEAKFLKVPDECIVCLTPTQALLNETCLKSKTMDEINKIVAERMELVSQCSPDRINVFGTYDELYGLVKASYKLRNRW